MTSAPHERDADADVAMGSQSRPSGLTESFPVQMWTALPDGALDFVNPRTADELGVSHERLMADGWQNVVHEDDLPRAVERWTHALRTGESYEVEFRLKLATGEYAWYLVRAMPKRDAQGEIVGWLGTNTNIEKERQHQERVESLLRQLESRAQELHVVNARLENARNDAARERDRMVELVDSTLDAFFELDRDFKIIMVNRNHENVSKVNREDALGRNFFDVYPMAPDSQFRLTYQRVVEEGVPGEFEDFYPPLDLWTEVRAWPTPAGGVAVFYRDIGRRKRLEAEREAAFASEQKGRRDAEAAQALAESANRMKDEFLSTVSHELRTPLNAILGWASMLSSGILEPARQKGAIDTIERNARNQVRLIDDLLDVARILQGKFRLAIGPVEAVRVVEAALESVRPAAEAKGLRLQRALDSHATIVGDAERLQQIAWNLLSNAIKFTPKGGRIHVTLRREASYVELAVGDTGQGIAPEFLPHVFEPFRQADGGITRRAGGLGLGLSIVRSLVELHGGTVSISSEGAGQGTLVTVRLPTAPVRASGEQPRWEASAPRPLGIFEAPPVLAQLRVLVVDDERDTRELIAFVLRQCESVVTLASSAAEAFALLERETFDVLISDVGMPEEDGHSFIRRVRQLEGPAQRVPATALTAYARSEDRAQALRAGFNMHLAKPVAPSELVLVIAALADPYGNPRAPRT